MRQSIARSSNADLEDVVDNNDLDGLQQRSSLVPKQNESSQNSLSKGNFASLLSNPVN
jgi:hypothetical protein